MESKKHQRLYFRLTWTVKASFENIESILLCLKRPQQVALAKLLQDKSMLQLR